MVRYHIGGAQMLRTRFTIRGVAGTLRPVEGGVADHHTAGGAPGSPTHPCEDGNGAAALTRPDEDWYREDISDNS